MKKEYLIKGVKLLIPQKNMAKNEADNGLFIPCYILLAGQ